MTSRVVLVGNKTAQSGQAAALIERASAELATRGVDHEVLETQPDGGTVAVVRRAIEVLPRILTLLVPATLRE